MATTWRTEVNHGVNLSNPITLVTLSWLLTYSIQGESTLLYEPIF